jgi:hypothetical protein
MPKLNVTRYKQQPGYCAVASCASIANYYDKNADYETTKVVARKKITETLNEGLDSGEIGMLLNHLGFNKVRIISTNLHFLDYSWSHLSKPNLIKKMKEMNKVYRGEYIDVSRSLCKWLSSDMFDNNLIIDFDFGKYIRESLDEKKPLIFSFNWNMYFRFSKYNKQTTKKLSDGCFDEHAVVAHGYTKQGVYVCDSHYQYYKYKLKEYREGRYIIPWEKLMTIIGWGDLFIPEYYG